MNPFYNIIRLCAGDFPAKALNFVTFVYLARILGVANYGVLEFALAIFTYFLFLADAGLELWATRESAQGTDMRRLAARIVPIRIVFASGSFWFLLVLLLFIPAYAGLTTLLVLLGFSLFAQAINLKWVFMGKEKMERVAGGLVLAQVVFTAAAFGFVRGPAGLVWIPLIRLIADLAMAAYFFRLFIFTYRGSPWPLILRGAGGVVRSALPLGGSQAVGLMNYNFDSVLLGLFSGPAAVGLYNAAYKPVTAALALPVTYYQGLFPALSRAFAADTEEFRDVVIRSLELTAMFALPLGILGTFFSTPIIDLLFGPSYAKSVPALQILSWSAVLATLRGTFKHGLNAAGKSGLDFCCGAVGVIVGVCLNFVLIPKYGIVGAAVATVSAEVLWFVTVAWCFNRYVITLNFHSVLLRPLAASGLMLGALAVLQSSFWGLRAAVGALVYAGSLLLLNGARISGLAAGWSAGAGGK